MKKYIYTVMLIFMAITVTQAQRMLPKQKGLEVSTGVLSDDKIGNDYYINIAMTVNGKNGNYQLWALEYTHQYHDYKEYQIGNLKFNVSKNYPYNFDTPLPAISESYISEDFKAGIFPQLIDKTDVKKGFISRKLSPQEKKEAEKVINNIKSTDK